MLRKLHQNQQEIFVNLLRSWRNWNQILELSLKSHLCLTVEYRCPCPLWSTRWPWGLSRSWWWRCSRPENINNEDNHRLIINSLNFHKCPYSCFVVNYLNSQWYIILSLFCFVFIQWAAAFVLVMRTHVSLMSHVFMHFDLQRCTLAPNLPHSVSSTNSWSKLSACTSATKWPLFVLVECVHQWVMEMPGKHSDH